MKTAVFTKKRVGVCGMQKTFSFMRQKLFVVLSASILLIGISSSFYMPYITLFGLREVGMTPMALGMFLSTATISGIIASTFVGRRSDVARSRKRLLMAVIVSGMAGFLVFAFSRDYFVLLLAAVFLISFSWSTFPQLFAFANEIDVRGREENRALINGILRSIFAIGWVVGPMIGAFLLNKAGFTTLYLAIVLVYFIILVIVWLFIKDRETGGTVLKGKLAINRALAYHAICFSVMYLATALNNYALPLFVTETLGASRKHIGYLLGLAAGIEIPLMIYGGYLVRHVGNLKLIKIGFMSYAAYAVSVLFVKELVWLYPIQVLNAIAISQIMSLGISYFQELAPDHPGTTITLFNNTSGLGSVMGGVVFGAIVTWFDYRMVYVFCAFFTLVALSLLYLANTRRVAGERNVAADV